jgi:hypothetical protein
VGDGHSGVTHSVRSRIAFAVCRCVHTNAARPDRKAGTGALGCDTHVRTRRGPLSRLLVGGRIVGGAGIAGLVGLLRRARPTALLVWRRLVLGLGLGITSCVVPIR